MRIAYLIIVAVLTTITCKGEPPAARVLDSNYDGAKVVQLNGLFSKLIGREAGRRDRSIGGISKAELRTKSYGEQIDGILQSEQFYREGFWHFHEDRLLPSIRRKHCRTKHRAL